MGTSDLAILRTSASINLTILKSDNGGQRSGTRPS